MNMNKLTPAPWILAPWTLKQADVIEGVEDEPCTVAKCWSSSFAPAPDIAKVNAEFIALARNAFDVMMRRGWGVEKLGDGWQIVTDEMRALRESFSDPFTALVEADKWHKENVET